MAGCDTYYLTDDVVDDAFSDMLRHAMLVAEVVLHENTLLLAAALPRRSREAEDIMVIITSCCDLSARCGIHSPFSSLSSPCRRAVADKIKNQNRSKNPNT
jgi:hypothetical protein